MYSTEHSRKCARDESLRTYCARTLHYCGKRHPKLGSGINMGVVLPHSASSVTMVAQSTMTLWAASTTAQ